MSGKIPLAKSLTFDDLAELIATDYRNDGRRSMPSLEQLRLPKLTEAFGGTKAIDITTTSVERCKTVLSSYTKISGCCARKKGCRIQLGTPNILVMGCVV